MLELGCVFDPTDEELVFHYLTKKVSGSTEEKGFDYIKDIDLYQHKPSELQSLAQDSGHQKWYFFTSIQKKYQEGKNINRKVAAGGFWRKTGPPFSIKDKNKKAIATKTSLTYYGKDQSEETHKNEKDQSVKTEWLMKEFMLVDGKPPNPNDEESEMLTLCYVYRSKFRSRSNRGKSSDVNNN